MQFSIVFLPLIIAFLTTVLVTPLCLYFIKKAKLLDDPKTHKHPAMIHTKPIPRGGGIPLFIGIVVAGFFFLPINKTTIALFIASSISLVVGVIDDKFDISRYVRFGINIACALIVIGSGVGVPFITSPFGGILHLDTIRFSFDFFGHHSILIVSDLIALLWIVWVINALNWSKGVDGQMPGVVAISAFVIGLLSLRFTLSNQLTLTAANLSFIIAGASIGFLIYNFYPAKIFPGYGATAMYLLLAVVSILSSAKLATAILVMGVPMVDGAFTVIRRIMTGRSPFWHDKKHLHHLLLKLGLEQRSIALFYWIVSAILGIISLLLTSTEKVFAIIMLIAFISGVLLFLHIMLREKHEKETF